MRMSEKIRNNNNNNNRNKHKNYFDNPSTSRCTDGDKNKGGVVASYPVMQAYVCNTGTTYYLTWIDKEKNSLSLNPSIYWPIVRTA